MDATDWANVIAERINCYGIADWLRLLADWLGRTPHELIPVEAAEQVVVDAPERGLKLVFRHPHAGYAEVADANRWILERAVFNPMTAALPFGLDGREETPESAKGKLGDDTSWGSARDIAKKDFRVSHFLADGRVVELTFSPTLQGLANVLLVRLGREMDYREVGR